MPLLIALGQQAAYTSTNLASDTLKIITGRLDAVRRVTHMYLAFLEGEQWPSWLVVRLSHFGALGPGAVQGAPIVSGY